MAKNPKIGGASTYLNSTTAANVILQTLSTNRSAISQWALTASKRSNLALRFEGNQTIGMGVTRGSTTLNYYNSAVVVLRADGKGGYHILTSYPKNFK